jgi:cysteinyl-tRNA synthetase
MSDDFNTPEAFAVLQSIARDLNTAKAEGRSSDARTLAGQLRQLAGILGLLRHDPEQWFKQPTGTQAGNELTDAQIEQLIKDRVAARQAKNWKESDRIRDLLAGAGIVLEDGPKGTTWRRR